MCFSWEESCKCGVCVFSHLAFLVLLVRVRGLSVPIEFWVHIDLSAFGFDRGVTWKRVVSL